MPATARSPGKRAYSRGWCHNSVTEPRSNGLAMIATRTGKALSCGRLEQISQLDLLLDRQTGIRPREQVLVDQHIATRITVRASDRRHRTRDQRHRRGVLRPLTTRGDASKRTCHPPPSFSPLAQACHVIGAEAARCRAATRPPCKTHHSLPRRAAEATRRPKRGGALREPYAGASTTPAAATAATWASAAFSGFVGRSSETPKPASATTARTIIAAT